VSASEKITEMDGVARNGVRNYMVTVFADEREPDGLCLLEPSHWPGCSFFVYQRELCPKTAREHFQGYLELERQMPFTAIQRQFEGLRTAHFEKRYGTQKQAIDYCSKEDTRIEGPWTYGEAKAQGERNDLISVKRALDEGMSLARVSDDFYGPWVKYHRSFKEYRRVHAKPRDFKSMVILIVGPSGVGKSRFATQLCSYLGTTYKNPDKHSGFWCDDYDGQDVFFMDEFDGDRMRPKAFNDLCDRYECVVPCHGSAGHQMVSRYIVIVSNYMPKYWWRKRSAAQLVQTTRRIDVVLKFIPRLRREVVFENGQFIHKLVAY